MRVLICCLIVLSAHAWAEPQIRVLLGTYSGATTMQMTGPHNAYLNGSFWYAGAGPDTRSVQAVAGSLYFDGAQIGYDLRLEPSDGLFYWNGFYYHGSLQFVAEANSLLVINWVDIEDYIKGVVPVEMKADWEFEALKAQAVASRTYVLAHLKPEAAYDLCATEGCQRYEGYSSENPRSNEAVDATTGVVVMYGGAYAETYYHADSGGLIASSEEVWGGDLPYLPAHEDISHSSPHSSWSVTLDATQMAASMTAIGKPVGAVSAMRITKLSVTGRVVEVSIQGSAGSTNLSGKTLRELLKAWGVRSTKFTMLANLQVQGSGYGHGVGMSQYGANAMAKSGYEFTQILGFYYPYTEIHRLGYAIAGTQ
ncbi:MAG: SpoIID/LytB domain-containing protein [Trueperaceae bacterium]|nr:SpoIID/LytB domain-containing protein [Trueperaceae bacterium]